MQVDGAVGATKMLRDKSVLLKKRVELAVQIFGGELQVTLPRKETVILEWIFDMLQTDQNALLELSIWQLLLQIWPKVPIDARLRVYKNHKFVSNLSQAILIQASSSQWFDLLTKITYNIAQSVRILNGASDQQVSQLVLAYLNAKKLLNLPQNQLGSLIFDNCSSRRGLFKKGSAEDIGLLLLESDNARHQYLVDFLSTPENPIVPDGTVSDDQLQAMITALCESQVNFSSRIIQLSRLLPDKVIFILTSIRNRQPQTVTADLVRSFLDIGFTSTEINWEVIHFSLEVSPGALLDNESQLNQVISSGPSETVALCLVKLAQRRRIFEFLETWKPVNVNIIVMNGLAKAMDLLSPVQLSSLIELQPPSIHLIIQSLKFAAVSSESVQNSLKTFLIETSNFETAFMISQLLPTLESTELDKNQNPVLHLRQLELKQASNNGSKHLKLHKSVVKSILEFDDVDSLVSRFFPTLELCLEKSELSNLLNRCSKEIKLKLSTSVSALENEIMTDSLINSSILHGELAVLVSIPKSLFSWEQRHAAVSMALQQFTFTDAGQFVCDLIDYQHLPEPALLKTFVSAILPEQTSVLIDLCVILKKDSGYIKQFSNGLNRWQKIVVQCVVGNVEESDLEWFADEPIEFLKPLTLCLSLLPTSSLIKRICTQLVLRTSFTPAFSSELFRLICDQDHHWSAICAVYVANNHGFESEFAQYLHTLKEEELEELILAACEEAQYGILRTLAKFHHFRDSHQKLVDLVVLRAIKLNENSTEFWEFFDCLLRSPTSKLLGQFVLEASLKHVTQSGLCEHWDLSLVVISRFILFKRYAFRNRLHLLLAALTAILQSVTTVHQADGFTRLVDNLVNPPQPTSKKKNDQQGLVSYAAKEKRHISKIAGVLLQNIVVVILRGVSTPRSPESAEARDWTSITQALRPAAFLLVDLLQNDGLKAASAGADSASRAYLRRIFEDYKLFEKWTSD